VMTGATTTTTASGAANSSSLASRPMSRWRTTSMM
jgi:hypothetical protein